MTVYHTFDRQILAKTETTEGTAIALSAANDYIDCNADVDVAFEVKQVSRDLVRSGFTMVPDFFASTGLTSGTMVATGTLSINIEFSLKTKAATPVDTAPVWATLLKACAVTETTSVQRVGIGAITDGPYLNREEIKVLTADAGQVVGTTFDGDSYLYYEDNATAPTSSDSVVGTLSTATATASSNEVPVGLAYRPDSTKGCGDNSSCTIQVYEAGRKYVFVGCRGSVSMAFASGDRMIMSFVMTGVLDSVANGTRDATINPRHAIPAAFTAAGLKLNEHGLEATPFTNALFNSLTFDVGNQVVMREDANSASGFKAAQITGRDGTVTLNPDAVVGGTTAAGVIDFMNIWAQGLSTRAEWMLGSDLSTKSGLFRMPCLQLDSQSFGDRDTIETFDISAKVTGGLIGDSVTAGGDGSARDYADRGLDNEWSIILM